MSVLPAICDVMDPDGHNVEQIFCVFLKYIAFTFAFIIDLQLLKEMHLLLLALI